MPQSPQTSPPRAMYGLFLCLAVVVALGGCASSTRLAMNDRPVPQPRPAVRPSPQPAPAMKSALGRPADPPAHVYTWNGSPDRVAETSGKTHAAPHAATTPYPAYGSNAAGNRAVAPPPYAAAAALQQPAAAYSTPPPVHLPRGSVLVQPGDTLYGLSRRHGVSISALMDENRLTSVNLQPGQVLKLPPQSRRRG